MWQAADSAPEGIVFRTKIHDASGAYNFANLKRYGQHWLYPDGEMYVYYTPTHYRPLTEDEQRAVIADIQMVATKAQERVAQLRFK